MNNNWMDGIARSAVQHAARRAPAALAERLEEEWLADFEERRGVLARLRFGIGCCWATNVIAHEYLAPKVAAASATGGSVSTTPYEQRDYSFLSGRTLAVLGIIGLHALIVYAFATGMVQKVARVIATPVAVIQPEKRVIDRPPPLPPPTEFQKYKPFVPDLPTQVPVVDDDPTLINPPIIIENRPEVSPPQPPPTEIKRVMGGPGKGFPNTDDFYPPQQIRAGVTGSTTVRVCTDDRGRLTGEPTIAQTSGSAGLDQGALRLAKSASGHYRPTTEDGRSVSSCYPFRVTFTMRN